jgi:hypothetical protein
VDLEGGGTCSDLAADSDAVTVREPEDGGDLGAGCVELGDHGYGVGSELLSMWRPHPWGPMDVGRTVLWVSPST